MAPVSVRARPHFDKQAGYKKGCRIKWPRGGFGFCCVAQNAHRAQKGTIITREKRKATRKLGKRERKRERKRETGRQGERERGRGRER